VGFATPDRKQSVVPLQPLVDPRAQNTDFSRGERFALAVGWHRSLRINASDQVNQPTALTITERGQRLAVGLAEVDRPLGIDLPGPDRVGALVRVVVMLERDVEAVVVEER